MEKRIALLTLSVVLIVAAFFVVLFDVIIPSSKYSEADRLFKEKEYLSALELYEELGYYKDSNDKAVSIRYIIGTAQFENKEYQKAYENFLLIIDYKDSLNKRNESGYAYAQQLMTDNNYEEAAKVFDVIKDYENSAELKDKCSLNIAKQLFDAKDYYGVITLYEQTGPFGEADELYKAACYNYGLDKSSLGNIETAIVYFTKADDYSDAKELIKLEKYNYVKSNMDKTNSITFEYLKELKDVGYKDSLDIYNEFYAWKVTVMAVNSDIGNRVTNKTSISKKLPVVFHYKLTGGAPDEKIVVNIKMQLPNGEVLYDTSEWAMKNGSVNWHGWENGIYENAGYGAEGMLKMEFYDTRNNLIGEGSVEITS